jgi:cobyrinic acid a,c-diamide synthase
MAGLLAVETSFARRKLHLGYRRARLIDRSPLGPSGTILYGHEFHYASLLGCHDEPLADVEDASGAPQPEHGSRRGTVTGTFFHVIDRAG